MANAIALSKRSTLTRPVKMQNSFDRLGSPTGRSLSMYDLNIGPSAGSSSMKDVQFQQLSPDEGSQEDVQSVSQPVSQPNSYASKFAPGSLFSLLSMLSILSLLSFGSIASALSLFSVGSFLSIASTASTLSFMSHGCYMKVYTDCRTSPTSDADFYIKMDQTTYNRMKQCTSEMYQQYKADDPACGEECKDQCGYQKLEDSMGCQYVDHKNNYETPYQKCSVRRKGSSTWRELDEKPSFKVKKLEEDVQFDEDWVTDKVTLNNMMFPGWFYQTWSEIDAYDTFRKLGVRTSPQARYTTVHVVVDGRTLHKDLYAMVQTISDKNYMKMHFEANSSNEAVAPQWSLYEKDISHPTEYKRSSSDFVEECSNCTEEQGDLLIRPPIHPNLGEMGKELPLKLSQFASELEAIRFYVAEVVTGSWDGVCRRKDKKATNTYIGYQYPHEFDGHDVSTWADGTYTLIPGGLDNTFQGCLSSWRGRPSDEPACTFMKECFQNDMCRRTYDNELEAAMKRTDIRKTASCTDELAPLIILFSVFSVLTFVLFATSYFRRGFDVIRTFVGNILK